MEFPLGLDIFQIRLKVAIRHFIEHLLVLFDLSHYSLGWLVPVVLQPSDLVPISVFLIEEIIAQRVLILGFLGLLRITFVLTSLNRR